MFSEAIAYLCPVLSPLSTSALCFPLSLAFHALNNNGPWGLFKAGSSLRALVTICSAYGSGTRLTFPGA